MSDDSMILKPGGIDSKAVWEIQNSPRAILAHEFYLVSTGIKNRAGQFVGFALTDPQLEKLARHKEARGGELAKQFFKQFSKPTDAADVGRFLLVGIEMDTFLDILAGIQVRDAYTRISEIATAHKAVPAKEINTKTEGSRW